MKNNIITIDIEESILEVFKYKQYEKDETLQFQILKNKEIASLNGYKAEIFLKFPKNGVKSFVCEIEENIIKVLLKKDELIKNKKIPFEIVLTGNEQIVTTFRNFLII